MFAAAQEIPRLLWVFVKTLFSLIHSKELMPVVLDGTVGAGIGFWVSVIAVTAFAPALVLGLLGGIIAGVLYTSIYSRQFVCDCLLDNPMGLVFYQPQLF